MQPREDKVKEILSAITSKEKLSSSRVRAADFVQGASVVLGARRTDRIQALEFKHSLMI
ncbi:hypothetical protein [Nostoc sp.]|uniref:hypothetical protein n=1 Tax=Nostoc sp. TaxID=1180 RepID=UPI002FFA664E